MQDWSLPLAVWGHALVQVPHCVVVFTATSQPFEWSPSQFPEPLMHCEMRHEPLAQVGIAKGTLHGVLHAPQCWMDPSCASQPVLARPSQSE